jgi:hypothetical protein
MGQTPGFAAELRAFILYSVAGLGMPKAALPGELIVECSFPVAFAVR